ncbi:MAG TPA: AAA family ATPase [Solirubrobacteraceae bacterium]|nr:AAA family ATPase [Solirubrobacteraceae bacterium]
MLFPRAPIGRKLELGEIESALDQVSLGRGRIVLVEGYRGLGKSTLLAEAGRQAGARGFTVVSGRGRGDERAAPGSALWSAVIRSAPAMSDRREAGELIGTFLSLAPAALVLDDAHLVDELSLRMLAELAERIRSRPVLLVVAAGTHLMDARALGILNGLRAHDHTLTIRLRALDDEGSVELIRAALPRAEPDFCSECNELTAGNPFLLSELAAWVGAHRIEPVAGAARRALAPLPPLTIREFVRRQLDDLGTDAAALAAAVAISDRPLTLEQAAHLAGFDGDRSRPAAEALLESGVLAPGEVLSFAAPLTGDCLRADTPAAVGADLHRRAAEMVRSGDLSDEAGSRHLLLAQPTGNAEVVDQLMQLADDEVAGGNLGQARTLIRRAIAENAEGTSVKPHLVARLGLVDLLEGRPGSTPTLAAAVAALDSPRDRTDALLKLGVSQVAAGAPRTASFSFDTARDLVGTDDPLGQRADVAGLLTRLLVPGARDGAMQELERRAQAADVDSSPYAAELLMAHAWLGLERGDPSSEVSRVADRALTVRTGDRSSINGYLAMAAAVLFATVDDFKRAHRICDTWRDEARDRGLLFAERSIELARAIALLHQGRLGEACELAQDLLGSERELQRFHTAEAAAILASGLHEQGVHDETEQIIRAALAATPADEPHGLLLLEVSARVWLEHGELGESLRAVAEAESLANALGVFNPALVAWQPTAAHCYKAVGQSRRAHALAQDALEVAESFGMPRAIALALRTKGEIEGPPGDLAHLRAALEVIDSSDAELERAKVLLAYGDALHRAGRDEEARGPLREGIGLADRLGAMSISRHGLATLRAAGGRPRRIRMAGPEALTPAERQVVDLAAAGATNREIAQALVITRKTVEWHLKKAYDKLDIRSRGQLSEVMEHDLAGASDLRGDGPQSHR